MINSFSEKVKKEQLSFSYKPEIGARGSEADELRFYINGKNITGIGRGFDGWKQEIIHDIIEEFENLNIKQKI
ncbi:hypothetical protein [Flavobacterium plurextorum]|uniref:hypothetical protein n=1 Tax=Flavobacterium plurextorum TaxID=1114867 RepID=UPI000F4EA9B0|nr:hypothetical protein [Flavobacterium plurextorum]